MLLSVIMPVHNTGKYLETCVESVYRQGMDWKEFEVILVNNASSDNSLEICRALAEKYPNILLIDTDIPGVSNARNMGLAKAQGRFVHFVDSDDCLKEGMYQAYQEAAQIEETDIIISGIDNYYEAENEHIYQNPQKKYVLKDKEALCDYIHTMTAEEKIWMMNVVWNKWYKRDILLDAKLEFDITLKVGEDFVFNCSIYPELQNGVILPQAYYLYYHRNAVSALNQFHKGELERRKRMENEQKKLYHNLGIKDKDKEIEVLNGELLFKHLYSVFRKDCDIEPKKYIKSVLDDELMKDIYQFFDSEPNGYYKTLKFMALHGSYQGFYFVMKAKYLLSGQNKKR